MLVGLNNWVHLVLNFQLMMVLILFNNHLLAVFGQGAADSKLISDLSLGEFVLVYETKYKGAGNSDSYKVFWF
jgi:hypothetical protein